MIKAEELQSYEGTRSQTGAERSAVFSDIVLIGSLPF